MLPLLEPKNLEPFQTPCSSLELRLPTTKPNDEEIAVRAYKVDSPGPAVYVLKVDELPSALSKMPCRSQILQDQEIARLERYRFVSDQMRVFASLLLRRCVLSLYDSRHPKAWKFVKGPHGKPEIAPESLDKHGPPLAFSVSTSMSIAVCAVSTNGPVGVDIEDASCHVDPEVPAGVLHPSELAEVEQSVPLASKPSLFFRYWTLKEALLKATGDGLLADMREVAFTGVRSSDIQLHSMTSRPPREWRFSSHQLFDTYVVSTAHGA